MSQILTKRSSNCVQSKGVFGRARVDTYQSFSAVVDARIPVLSMTPTNESQQVTKAKLVVDYDGLMLKEYDFINPDVAVSEINYSLDSKGRVQNLTLAPDLRYIFGNMMRSEYAEALKEGVPDTMTLSLELHVANGFKYKIKLQSWDRPEQGQFRKLFYVTASRYLRPSYYAQVCSRILRSH